MGEEISHNQIGGKEWDVKELNNPEGWVQKSQARVPLHTLWVRKGRAQIRKRAHFLNSSLLLSPPCIANVLSSCCQ